MTTKLFCAATLSFIGIATLSGQNLSMPLQHTGVNESNVGSLVSQLGQNALTVLLGMVVLMSLVGVFCIGNACVGLKKKPKNAPASSLLLCLCVAAGLSVCGSGCTAAQKAQAAEIHAARAAEGGICVCHAPLDNHNYYGNSGLSSRYSNDIGRPFCRQCGQRIYYRNR